MSIGMHGDVWRGKWWHFEAFRSIDSSCINIDIDIDVDMDTDIGLISHHPSSKVVAKVMFIAAEKTAIRRSIGGCPEYHSKSGRLVGNKWIYSVETSSHNCKQGNLCRVERGFYGLVAVLEGITIIKASPGSKV